eukprot:TRINITY_DN2105_c0_g1_i3.p1 TRINITY_DN2105_c0_g1~~TRINITY_DN2105_c0_g1_i3.p1  ORF type:complete len:1094 (+),score=237.25 TRINITY_DN2105_c0_g1_i3:915-4196(+)
MSSERRLLRDLKELAANPLLTLTAAPLENNILEWHGNLTGSTAPFDKVVFHFIMKFGKDYPSSPPSLILCTPVPHRNVFPSKKTAGEFVLCLDMLENDEFVTAGQKVAAYKGWSSSYSVASILLQLEAFLLDPEFIGTITANRPSINTCISQAKQFKCSCGHNHAKPFPNFPTKEEIAMALKVKIEVTKPCLQIAAQDALKAKEKAAKPKFQPKIYTAVTSSSSAPTSITTSAVTKSSPTTWKPTPAPSLASTSSLFSQPVPKKVIVETPWSEWKGRVAKVPASKENKGKNGAKPPAAVPAKANSIYDHLMSIPANSKAFPSLGSAKPEPAVVKKVEVVVKEPVGPSKLSYKQEQYNIILQQTSVKAPKPAKSASANSGFVQLQLQSQRKPQRLNQPVNHWLKAAESAVVVPTPVAVATPVVVAPPVEEEPIVAPAEEAPKKETPKSKATKKEAPKKMAPKKETAKKQAKASSEKSVDAEGPVDYSASPIMYLPYEILHSILMQTELRDVVNVSETCSWLHTAVEDGLLWRQLFSKHHPISHFTAKNMSDWKYLFQMEIGRIFDSLKCYHSKVTYKEDVLGIPLEVTINPRLQEIDHIYTTSDLLCAGSYFQEKVRHTVWKEQFTYWMPLYIDQEHFSRALPFIEKSTVRLSEHWKTQKFSPYMLAEVIPKMMNTMVILLSDKGVHASEKALSGFCALHRLFIALIRHYPGLQAYIDKQITDFCSDSRKQHKNETPNLGILLPLLTVSSIPWRKALPIILSESFDRNFIWCAKKFPELAKSVSGTPGAPDFDRINKTFESSLISLRLMMFHILFLRRFRKTSDLDEIASDYDRYYGFPSQTDLRGYQNDIAEIMKVSNWPGFYRLCELKMPSPLELTKILVEAMRNSLKKKYHTNKTDFSRIHSSGVSKILLKGESYTCNTNLNEVRLEEIWRFTPYHTQYLDASCLIYHFDSTECTEVVDYCHTSGASGAIRHSGDVLDSEKGQGKHIITVSLKKLPATVQTMYFTITAFHTTLTSILNPEILFLDPESNQELCAYQFGDNKGTGDKTAVIMAKLSRANPSAPWNVLALGHLGMGMAGNYNSIKEDILARKL